MCDDVVYSDISQYVEIIHNTLEVMSKRRKLEFIGALRGYLDSLEIQAQKEIDIYE